MTNPIYLDHRAVIAVKGEDAASYLAGLVTNTISDTGTTRYAALLTPQGKVIADFLVYAAEDGFLFDCARSVRDDLMKRLSMYKLRSKVDILPRDDLVAVAFSGPPDPRSNTAPARSLVRRDTTTDTSLASYHAARIAAGLAEQSIDFEAGEVFPADINMDGLSGIDFAKGCFVGQEVVSRMKRRGTARRRTLALRFADGAPPAPAPVLADDFEIGQLTSASEDLGLARVRIDHLAEAEAAGHTITANGRPCSAIWPDWLVRPPLSGAQSTVD